MANLDLIRQLNRNYDKSSPISRSDDMISINEGFDHDKIGKALTNFIADLGPLYAGYFDMGLPVNVAMIFIDICNFSTRFGNLDGEQIGAFFDDYYDLVIPIIYKYGGEIDKIIGDGIIAVFGPPFIFSDFNDYQSKADQCSREVIKETVGTDFSSKVALHSGQINYFKNKTGLYKEFTMIGKPLTELFRLEGISEDNCINYYEESLISKYYENIMIPTSATTSQKSKALWKQATKPIYNLKGIAYNELSYIRYQPKN